MTWKKQLFLFCAFGCVGITTEIFFTALVDLKDMIVAGHIEHFRLQGKSYIWMFPIYGLAGIAWPLLYKRISALPLLARMAVYGLGILIVEYITGFALDQLTGSCPWEYTEGYHLHGYIRFDFFFFWAFFGYAVELIYLLLKKLPI